jgi:hypothetical protein
MPKNTRYQDKLAEENVGYYEMMLHKPWFDEGRSSWEDKKKGTKLQWLQQGK